MVQYQAIFAHLRRHKCSERMVDRYGCRQPGTPRSLSANRFMVAIPLVCFPSCSSGLSNPKLRTGSGLLLSALKLAIRESPF